MNKHMPRTGIDLGSLENWICTSVFDHSADRLEANSLVQNNICRCNFLFIFRKEFVPQGEPIFHYNNSNNYNNLNNHNCHQWSLKLVLTGLVRADGRNKRGLWKQWPPFSLFCSHTVTHHLHNRTKGCLSIMCQLYLVKSRLLQLFKLGPIILS